VDKETVGQEDKIFFYLSPCLLVPLSPCPLVFLSLSA
jgi:hypothetical protein